MLGGGREIDVAVEKIRDEYENVLRLVTEQVASRIVDLAEEFAPDETDFRTAIHEEGPEGEHALIVVEDEVAEFIKARPRLIDAMKMSEEFDNEADQRGDLSKAARAIVNESLFLAEVKWDDRPAPAPRA